jgi:uncharacterized membrane protein YeaQ/YmgE (transglycosylase-associated protein family)
MGILAWILFGYIIGLIARAVLPGRQNMGFVMTTLLGVIGSLVGGFIGSMIGGHAFTDFTPAGFIGSLLGALAVLFIAGGLFVKRRATV